MKKLRATVDFIKAKSLRIISDKLVNNIFWNSLARFGSAGLNFLITVFLMSILGVGDYGEFVVFFSIYSTIPFFFDFGLNSSFISIGAKLRVESHKEYQEFISTYFSIKAAILFLMVIAIPFGMVFKIWSNSLSMVIALGAVLGMWEFFLTIFRSRQDFKLLSILLPVRNLLSLGFILSLYYFLRIDSWQSYLYAIMLVPLLLSAIIYFSFFRGTKLKLNSVMLKNTFAVSKWVTLFTLITAVHARADIFLLEYFASTNRIEGTEVGIFSAAFSLLSVINIVTSSFSEAVLPKISEESNSRYFMEFKNRIKGTVSYVVLLALIVGGVLYFVFSYGFNGKYVSSINCMFFIGIGMILTFYIHTLSTMFYPLQRTDLVFKAILLMFCVNILVGFLLIPVLGSIGAAITNLVVAFSGLVFTVFSLNKLLVRNGDVGIQ